MTALIESEGQEKGGQHHHLGMKDSQNVQPPH